MHNDLFIHSRDGLSSFALAIVVVVFLHASGRPEIEFIEQSNVSLLIIDYIENLIEYKIDGVYSIELWRPGGKMFYIFVSPLWPTKFNCPLCVWTACVAQSIRATIEKRAFIGTHSLSLT